MQVVRNSTLIDIQLYSAVTQYHDFIFKKFALYFILGRYPCLWCLILATEMHLPKNQRTQAQVRTLEGMQEHLMDFKEKGGGPEESKKVLQCDP